MTLDDAQLIRQARDGDLASATELVDRFYSRVYAFLRRLAGSEADAADLTQQTFARVWPALDRFAGRSSFNSWIHGIAYHVFLDWLRADRRHAVMPDDWWADCPDGQLGPDARAAAKDLEAAVYAAVDELAPELRSTVHLHYYQGLTLEETAAALDISTSTVKYRLRHGLERLQTRLADRPALQRPLRLIPQP